MKNRLLATLIFGLSASMIVPAYAQQKASSSRRQQPRTQAAPSATENKSVTDGASVSNENAGPQRDFARPSRPNNGPEGPGGMRGARMGSSFALMALQMQAYQTARDESGKVDIAKFTSEFMQKAKAADENNDSILSAEELQKMLENMRPNNGERPDGANRGGDGRRRASRNGDVSVRLDSSDVVYRAQEGPRPGNGGFPGPNGPNGPAINPLMNAISESSDEDGNVDLKKLEKALTNALKEADKDSDGTLDNSEWMSFNGMGGGFMGGAPGQGFGMGGRPNTMWISMLQRQVVSESQTADGKIEIAKFRSKYLELLKEADSNKDGVLDSDEVQALLEKIRETMGGPNGGGFGFPGMGGGPNGGGFGFPGMGGGPNGGGFGFPGMGGGFGGPNGGSSPFEQFKNNDGKIDLSKINENMPFAAMLKNADTDKDGLLDDNELQAMQEQLRSQFGPRGNGEGGPGRQNGGARGDGNGRNMRNRDSFGYEISESSIIRAQEEFGGRGGQRGNRENGPQEGRRGGMPGGMGGMPRMGGMPGMPGMGRGGFGGNNVIQKAANKALKEDGGFDIKAFDVELGLLLSNADNEDDGLLNRIEQEEAFGRVVAVDENAPTPNGGNTQGERRGPGEGREGGRRPDAQNGVDMSDRMQAFRVQVPDDSFVGVPANESFKFAKARKEGDSAEKSPIEADYAIGKYEVRNREYKEFVDATSRKELPKNWVDGTYPVGMKNCPVVNVSLKDAEDYCEWLASKYEGWTFRLPSEAEFENAAAGTKKLRYPWGANSGFTYSKGTLTTNCQYNAAVIADLLEKDTQVSIANKKSKLSDVVTVNAKGVVAKGWRDTKEKSGFTYSDVFMDQVKLGGYVVPVTQYRSNESPYGCIGMAGNAAEWTTSVVDGKNVVRGGSWYSSADECSSVHRGETKDSSKGDPTVGFRVVAERIE